MPCSLLQRCAKVSQSSLLATKKSARRFVPKRKSPKPGVTNVIDRQFSGSHRASPTSDAAVYAKLGGCTKRLPSAPSLAVCAEFVPGVEPSAPPFVALNNLEETMP